MDEFFSESKPDLINKKTLYNFERMLKKKSNITTEETYWSSCLYFIYDEYIKPNIFFIIVIILLALFLIYRYMTKSNITGNFDQIFLHDELPSKINSTYFAYNNVDQPIKYPNILDKIQDKEGISSFYEGGDENQLQNNPFIDSDYVKGIRTPFDYTTKQNKRDIDLLAEIMFRTPNPNNNESYPGMGYAPLYTF